MGAADDEAWEMFVGWIRRARPALDGCVPVVLIAIPVERVAEAGAIEVAIRGDARIIWPQDFPVQDRGKLLEALARTYRDGAVRR